jgi:hypothetical protein
MHQGVCARQYLALRHEMFTPFQPECVSCLAQARLLQPFHGTVAIHAGTAPAYGV